MTDIKEKWKIKMYKIIALIGKAGSGKDSILHSIMKVGKQLNLSFHEVVSCTTRPKRENEIEGVNYHYLDDYTFKEKETNGEMLEYTKFNNWWYGTSYDSLNENKINIGVFNPAGIRSLMKHKNVEVHVYYIDASPKNRLIRQLEREKDPNVAEIIRRYCADENDFSHLDFPYKKKINDTFDDYFTSTYEIAYQVRVWADKGNFN